MRKIRVWDKNEGKMIDDLFTHDAGYQEVFTDEDDGKGGVMQVTEHCPRTVILCRPVGKHRITESGDIVCEYEYEYVGEL